MDQEYEIDEIMTKLSGTRVWLTYAINRRTKEVVSFIVGDRKKETQAIVVNKVLALKPLKIYTDHWLNYRLLIPKRLHYKTKYQTNNIERENLNLRTHLKYLHRQTICYAKPLDDLKAVLKLYWYSKIKTGYNIVNTVL